MQQQSIVAVGSPLALGAVYSEQKTAVRQHISFGFTTTSDILKNPQNLMAKEKSHDVCLIWVGQYFIDLPV